MTATSNERNSYVVTINLSFEHSAEQPASVCPHDGQIISQADQSCRVMPENRQDVGALLLNLQCGMPDSRELFSV